MRLRGKRPAEPLPQQASPDTGIARGVFEAFPEPLVIVEAGTYRVVEANAKARAGMTGPLATCHDLLWGSTQPCRPSTHPCPVDQVMQTWMPVTFQRVVTTEDGSTRIREITGFPLKDASGNVRHIALVFADVTDRKTDEHSQLSTERFRAVGELAGSVAHRFNNLLQVVVSGAQVALADLDSGDPTQVRSVLQEIMESVGKGQQTVMHLLDVARAGSEANAPGVVLCDLSVIVGQAIAMLSPSWMGDATADSRGVSLNEELTSGCVVRGRKSELLELATILIRGALTGAPEGGRVRVTTQERNVEVVLTVSHPGKGLAKDDGPLAGTSVRMEGGGWVPTEFAAAQIITERLGGSLTVDRADLLGPSFTVRLPNARVAAREGGAAVEKDAQLSILVVDDNREVLAAIEDGLRRFGQLVVTAPSGREALQILKGRRVDAVVCDFAMPEMNGLEVGREITEIFHGGGPAKPAFILLTGWLSDRDRGKIEAAGVDRLLQKPVEPARLIALIRSLVAAKRP
ncbi:MAG: response regulator [Candidatus Eisenbacteria bacterium]|jgi:CheY-like chemotaxis protein|nr:response regulator [Candidatus Eisenbacteria bacterium]